MNDQKKKIAIIATAVVLAVALVVGMVVLLTKKDAPVDTETPDATNEIATYYFDAGIDEYTLTLNDDNTFVLYIKNTYAGTYTLKDGALALTFNASGMEAINATLANGVVNMTFNGANYNLLKKVTFTASFESNGGSGVEAQSVLNGKTVTKPADPTRDGYLFIGWYADAEFKTPFEFSSQTVTADTTVYARWTEKGTNEVEFNVNFDLNYDDAAALEAGKTVGGKLFGLPTAEREGYTFNGWWVSMTNDASKLSYRYEEGMALTSDETLYALWETKDLGGKLPAPVVNVTAGTISWSTIEGARSYDVTITAPNGFVETQSVSANTMNYTFDLVGEYTVKVVANANSGEANNSEAVRYYTNRMLGKVYGFQIIDGNVLVYNTVANAEKYLVTVVCGNAEHKHTEINNGTSRTFSFSNCEMTEGGIKFIVKAVANGYATSVSETFVFERSLASVEGLRYDEATQTVHWNTVPGAAEYIVSVSCGNENHYHLFDNNGSKTSVCIKNCDALEGGIVVSVFPKTAGYNSPEASEIKVNKTTIATPENIILDGTVLTWNAVNGATKYEIMVGDKKLEATECTVDIAAVLEGKAAGSYAVTVRAIGATESLASDAVSVVVGAMSNDLKYSNGFVTWSPVYGADAYEYQVNDGEIYGLAAVTPCATVELTKSGVNVIKVRYCVGNTSSAWATLEVYAYAVSYDSRGGSKVETKYFAVGDTLELPVPTKAGYTFSAWYNVPGGAATNGKVYAEGTTVGATELVLFAYYTPNKYTINYNFGEGGSSDVTTGEVYFENHYQLLVPTANDTSITFGGWFSAPYGMGVRYTDANGNSLAPWTETEGAELYAYWISDALKFTQTKLNGKDVYMVSAGERIALLTEVTVPASYKGLPVAVIAGNAFMNCTNMKVLNLPATIEQISIVDPFTGCSGLEAVNVYAVDGINNPRFWSEDGVLFDNGVNANKPSILLMPMAKTGSYRIPANITEIPAESFANSNLTEIVIPASVTKIGREAFANCTKLNSVIFESEQGEQALTIAARAFNGCTALQTIKLPARLTDIVLSRYTIGASGVNTDDINSAFVGCTSLNSITVAKGSNTYKAVDGVLYSADGKTLVYCPETKSGAFAIPAGTQTVAAGAFIGCTEITEITVPNTVTLIGECAFYGLSENLVKLTIAGNAFNDMVIDDYAFAGCSALADVVFESGCKISTISKGAFMGSGIKALNIPASVSSIEADAFKDCSKLASVTFAENGKTLKFGANVFANCTSITSVALPANVSEVPGIFNGCTKLESVTVAEDSAYFTAVDGVLYSKDMTSVIFFPKGKSGEFVLPETVTTIGDGVFNGVKLDKLTIYNTVATIGSAAFQNSSITTLVFEAPVSAQAATELNIGAYAFYGADIDAVVLPAHTKTLGEYVFATAKIDSITLNEGLQSFGEYAFYSNTYISSIEIPSTVKTIPAHAFDKCTSLATVTLNEGIESIEEYAFYNMGTYYFYSVTIPASVTNIGNYAFASSGLKNGITFAENSALKTIGAHAFEYCRFTTITIPNSVTGIGSYAFANMNYYLEEVIFEEGGTEDLVLGTEYVYSYTDYTGKFITEYQRGYVFYYAYYLSKVVLPSRLTVIGDACFYSTAYYGSLDITFGENSRLTTIGEKAFYYSGLSGEVVIPKSVKNMPAVTDGGASYNRLGIGAYAFYGTDVSSVIFEEGSNEPLTIGEKAFASCYYALTEVTLPARLASYTSHDGTVIDPLQGGAAVFDSSSKLVNIFVADGENMLYADIDGVLYKTTGTDAVVDGVRTPICTELLACPVAKTGTVTVPSTVTKIYANAFYYCEYVEAIVFEGGNADMTIGDKAFYRCKGLTTLVLPDNVVAIGESAFYNCSSLTSLTLSKNLTAFNGGMVESCYALAEIKVGADGKGINFSAQDGVLYNADMTVLVMYPGAREGSEFVVPATVKTIASKAFADNEALEIVVLPVGLEKIDDSAFFYATALKTVNVPNTVTYIGTKAFSNCSKLETVTFDENGTELLIIGNQAFYYATKLSAAVLPERLAALGDYAFDHSGIETLEFGGDKLMTLGNNVFSNTKLVNVTLPDGIVTIGDQLFYGATSLKTVTFGDGLVSIGYGTFGGATAIEEVNFPASLKTMGMNTFYYSDGYNSYYCSNLKKVTFGEASQLQSIPSGTFAYTGLTSFTVPATVTEIADRDPSKNSDYNPGAFAGCSALTRVTFEQGTMCSNIGDNAFYGCTALVEIDIPTRVSRLGTSSFSNCTSLESIVIPESCTKFGEYVFYGATALADIDLKSAATEFPAYMFYRTAITSIVIPDTVSHIGHACFAGTPLVEVTVPAGVESMGWGVFSECEELERVTMLAELVELPDTTFEGCVKLTDVKLPSTVEIICEDAFAGCTSLTTITLPAALKEMESAFVGSGLAEYKLEAGNTTYAVSEGVLFSADMTKILSYPANRTADSFTIPKEVTEIGASTFAGITSLKNVTFEEGGVAALVIGDEAFYKCTGLEFIVLPERTTVVGQYAFYGCSNLMSVEFPSTLEEIGYDAFYSCPKLLQVGNYSDIEINFEEAPASLDYYMIYYYDANGGHMYDIENSDYYDIIVVDYPGQKSAISVTEDGYVTFKYSDDRTFVIGYKGEATEITIPDTITDIYSYAFYKSNITKVTISDNVQIIWGYAFRECDALTEVNLNGNLKYVLEYGFYKNANLAIVNIPVGIDYMDYSVFSGCYEAVLLIREESIPYDWASSFVGGAKLVIWGYNGQQNTYTFISEGVEYYSITSDSVIGLPTEPVKTGYIFLGWYDNEELTGSAIASPYYKAGGETFYAKWMSQEEFDSLFAGTSAGYAIDAVNGASHTIVDDSDSVKGTIYFKVTATEDVTLTITTVSGLDTVIRIYNDPDDADSLNYGYIKNQDGYGSDETLTYTFSAGETYYIAAYIYSKYDNGTFTVNVTVN